jgi:serine protease AprX
MANFSSVGPTSPDGWVKPDLVTSGRSVVSLAAPGSTIDNGYPSAQIGQGNFVGSGTSFSAAIVSGAAALVLADNPGLTPDQIKARLLGNTNPGPVGNPFVDGHGALNAYAAAQSGPMDFAQSVAGLVPVSAGATVSLSPASPADTWNASLWTGLNPPDPSVTQIWNGWQWDGSAWNAWTWTGKAWNNDGWDGAQWDGEAWTGKAWNNDGWDGSSWAGSAWDGNAWDGSSWN